MGVVRIYWGYKTTIVFFRKEENRAKLNFFLEKKRKSKFFNEDYM